MRNNFLIEVIMACFVLVFSGPGYLKSLEEQEEEQQKQEPIESVKQTPPKKKIKPSLATSEQINSLNDFLSKHYPRAKKIVDYKNRNGNNYSLLANDEAKGSIKGFLYDGNRISILRPPVFQEKFRKKYEYHDWINWRDEIEVVFQKLGNSHNPPSVNESTSFKKVMVESPEREKSETIMINLNGATLIHYGEEWRIIVFHKPEN